MGNLISGLIGDGGQKFLKSIDKYSTLIATYPAASYPDFIIYVENGEGGIWPLQTYPRGFYRSTGTVWVPDRIQVQNSVSTASVEPISVWADYLNADTNKVIYEMVNWSGVLYFNITGVFTSSDPSVDTTNWKQLSAEDIAFSSTALDSTNVKTAIEEVEDNAIAYADDAAS